LSLEDDLKTVGGHAHPWVQGERQEAGNSLRQTDPTTGQQVLEMGSGGFDVLRGKQKVNLMTKTL
jgi:hypothetical protein